MATVISSPSLAPPCYVRTAVPQNKYFWHGATRLNSCFTFYKGSVVFSLSIGHGTAWSFPLRKLFAPPQGHSKKTSLPKHTVWKTLGVLMFVVVGGITIIQYFPTKISSAKVP